MLLRWMKDPEFDTAYREARRLAFRQSVARLQQASSAAVSTLLNIMRGINKKARLVPTAGRGREVQKRFGPKGPRHHRAFLPCCN
jgi:hypothetical protein